MKLSKTTTTLLIALGVTILVAAFFIFQATSSTEDDGIITEGEVSTEAEAIFINLASQINSISFDTSLFNDPRFASLVDIRVAIIPEAAGRKDPFALINGVVAPTR